MTQGDDVRAADHRYTSLDREGEGLVPFRHPAGEYDEVELRASKNSKSIVVFLQRSTAVAQRGELELDGWSCDIREVDRGGAMDGPGATSRRVSERESTTLTPDPFARLTGRMAELTGETARLLGARARRDRGRGASLGEVGPNA
jgi:hypothetical protein